MVTLLLLIHSATISLLVANIAGIRFLRRLMRTFQEATRNTQRYAEVAAGVTILMLFRIRYFTSKLVILVVKG